MKLEIINNVFLQEGRFLLELSGAPGLGSVSPGQFLHLRIEDSCDPLLRRPFSIHDVNKGSVKILYEVVGKGTELLSEKRPESLIDALGPLGRGFDLGKIGGSDKAAIVAGGMGVAPLFFLAKRLTEGRGQRAGDRKIAVLIGAKTKSHILCEKELKNLGCEVHIATEDGSRGFKGKVTELLRDLLPVTDSSRRTTICACGPKDMLAAVAEIGSRRHCPVQVSLEEFMGCGLGACLGCCLRTTAGYKRICSDGPVFDASEILWRE